jgi:hypothetical protein
MPEGTSPLTLDFTTQAVNTPISLVAATDMMVSFENCAEDGGRRTASSIWAPGM